MDKENGTARAAVCAALLLLLCVSGYMGAGSRERAEMVSVPIVFEAIEAGSLAGSTNEDGVQRLKREQEHALSLLEDVIRDPKASEQTVQSALMQKAEIAENMEKEARLIAALEQLGIEDAAAVMGEQILSIFVPEGMLDDKNRMQIVDMAASVTGVSAEYVKIILVKNE